MLACTDPQLAAGLALASALLFSLGIHCSRGGLRHLDSRSATLITIATATGLYWIASPWFLERHFWLSPAIALFALIGLFRPALSGNLAMAGTHYLGPTISSTLAATAPLFGVALGVVMLGEDPGAGVLIGTIAIVSGVALLSRRGESALACGRLVVVAPIVACSPLFTLLLGVLVFRERGIGARVAAAVALIVPGVVLVTLRA